MYCHSSSLVSIALTRVHCTSRTFQILTYLAMELEIVQSLNGELKIEAFGCQFGPRRVPGWMRACKPRWLVMAEIDSLTG
jgi:hypothetical protein